MCGIAGLVDLNSSRPARANRQIATSMAEAIRHRGPDASGVWGGDAGVWLSHRRLAIVDTSEAGGQPMVSASGETVISYNGEVYNAAELRSQLRAAGYAFRGHSDTEALLYACELWGPVEAARRALGMFAFACWNARSRCVTLVRDRLGKKPLYWFRSSNTFAFASELRPLLLHEDCPRDIDPASVAEFLRFTYVAAPHSIFRGVHKVEPGGFLTLDVPKGEVRTGSYWSIREVAERASNDPFTGSPDDAVAETEQLLLDATRIRMVADVPLGAFLSGGIDSSLVTALMQEVGSGRARTFSIGSLHRDFDDAADAAKVAAHLGTDHTSFIVNPAEAISAIGEMPKIFDEPFADTSQVPTYLVSKLARGEVTVAMSGDGGDEVFGGYNRHVAAAGLLGRASRLPGPIRSAVADGITRYSPDAWQVLFNLLPKSIRPRLAGDKLHKFARALSCDGNEQYRSLLSHWQSPSDLLGNVSERAGAIDEPGLMSAISDPVARMRYLDLATYLPGDILTKVDRASMAVGLEARAPLLDHRLVEWSFRVPTSTHLRDGKGKWLLRRLLEKRLPAGLINKPKSGFDLPIGEWLRGPLRAWAEALLEERALSDVGIQRTDLVREVWRKHLRRASNAEDLIWPILMLVQWHSSTLTAATTPELPQVHAFS